MSEPGYRTFWFCSKVSFFEKCGWPWGARVVVSTAPMFLVGRRGALDHPKTPQGASETPKQRSQDVPKTHLEVTKRPSGMREAIRRPIGDGVLNHSIQVFLNLPDPSKAKFLTSNLRLPSPKPSPGGRAFRRTAPNFAAFGSLGHTLAEKMLFQEASKN